MQVLPDWFSLFVWVSGSTPCFTMFHKTERWVWITGELASMFYGLLKFPQNTIALKIVALFFPGLMKPWRGAYWITLPSDTCDLVPEIVPKKIMGPGSSLSWDQQRTEQKNSGPGIQFLDRRSTFLSDFEAYFGKFSKGQKPLRSIWWVPWPSMTCWFKQVASSRISPTSEQISSTPEVAWWNDHCSAMSYEPIIAYWDARMVGHGMTIYDNTIQYACRILLERSDFWPLLSLLSHCPRQPFTSPSPEGLDAFISSQSLESIESI